MKTKSIALILTASLYLAACAPSSFQWEMKEIWIDNETPADIYDALKDVTVSDEAEEVQLQATRLWYAFQTPSASVRAESQKLLQLLEGNNLDISTADNRVQTMVYLSALANNNNVHNHKINANIKQVIDQLCVPSNKIYQRIDEIDEMREVLYDFQIAQACVAILNDESAAKNVSLAVPFFNERGCYFTENTSTRLFMSELIECRLKRQGVQITDSLPLEEL